MLELPCQINAPIAWLPAGLISWYAPGRLPMALVTSWIALIGGEGPRLRTAWHGLNDPLAKSWAGGDFVLNVPDDPGLQVIREAMRQGKLCLNVETDLRQPYLPGIAALAPRLTECAVQIECRGGKLVDVGFEDELCGDVVRVHRAETSIDPGDIADLCAIQPLSPRG